MNVSGTVRNSGSATESYLIQVSVLSKEGKRLYATAALAKHVPPSNAGPWTVATNAAFIGMSSQVRGLSVATSP